jgi:hypothetical protein
MGYMFTKCQQSENRKNEILVHTLFSITEPRTTTRRAQAKIVLSGTFLPRVHVHFRRPTARGHKRTSARTRSVFAAPGGVALFPFV